MEKILKIDLSTDEIIHSNYEIESYGHYGRGLAMNLLEKEVPKNTKRYSKENAIILVPGLFTGCKVASACRIMIATKMDENKGMQLSNTTGNLPQKLASLQYAGVVIKGIAKEKNSIIHISKEKIEIISIAELENKNTSELMKLLKNKFGANAGIIAVGKSADMQMSLSTFICTYPEGEPEYHCPRSGFGDVFGSKNIRAIVVTEDKYFERECKQEDDFIKKGKELAKLIVNNEICGGALPSHGSITLIKLLENKNNILNLTKNIEPKHNEKDSNSPKKSKKINFCCAPMCVIGCLNRHSVNDGQVYSSPDESEVMEALKICFGINDYNFTKKVREKAYEIGIVGTEFVTAAKMYFEATGITVTKENILNLLEEIEKGSVVGRLVASRTFNISKLYSDNINLNSLIDKKAIDDENKFNVSLFRFDDELKDLSDLELLYYQIFILENLGFCIFSSFAIVNNKKSLEIMADLFEYKTGIKTTPLNLINYARQCMNMEMEYEKQSALSIIQKNIPPFTKVLYRYFEFDTQAIQ